MLNRNGELAFTLSPPAMTGSTGRPVSFAPIGKGGGTEAPLRIMAYSPVGGPLIAL